MRKMKSNGFLTRAEMRKAAQADMWWRTIPTQSGVYWTIYKDDDGEWNRTLRTVDVQISGNRIQCRDFDRYMSLDEYSKNVTRYFFGPITQPDLPAAAQPPQKKGRK